MHYRKCLQDRLCNEKSQTVDCSDMLKCVCVAADMSFHVCELCPTRGMKKGSLKLSEAAMVSTGSRQPSRAPNRMSLPM